MDPQNFKDNGIMNRISHEDFDLLTENVRFVDAVQKGLADVKNGRVLADEDLDKEL